jgi:hypothetical protein
MPTTDDSFVASGPARTGFNASVEQGKKPFDFGVTGFGRKAGVLGEAGLPGPLPASAFSGFAGVIGISLNNVGVYGETGAPGSVPDFAAGIYGTGNLQPGIIGFSRDGDGAQGLSFTGTAFRAASFFGPGINSISGALTGVTGISGTQGPTPVGGLPTTAGVLGSSDTQAGVIGTSNRTAGVLGFSNNIGVFGQGTNFAGVFQGNLLVTGTKSAAVHFPDGTQRALYCMESPELWFEDFGTAKLTRGRAVVKLDADFAKVITRDYRVFLSPEGDCRGLYVRKSAGSFEVREFGGGKSNVAFSYRVVGRRRDITRHRRFAKIDTRLPIAPTRTPRRKPTEAALRKFITRLEKEAREREPKRS